MKIKEIEKIIIIEFLKDMGCEEKVFELIDRINVTERSYSGGGFLADFKKEESIKLLEEKSFNWGKVGAFLNDERIDTGYLIYIENGYLVSLEGYTYDKEWPEEINKIEIYSLNL